jgi:AraC-like DNA-binding protein
MATKKQAQAGIASDIVVAVAEVVRGLGHAEAPPSAVSGMSPGEAADAWFDRAAAALGEPLLGARVAAKIPIGALGPVDYALCTGRDVGEGLGRVARYYAAASQRVSMEIVAEAEAPGLNLHRRAGVAHSRQWIEFSVAMIAERIRQTVGNGNVRAISFSHPAGAPLASYRDVFSLAPSFEQPLDSMRFVPSLLDAPLKTASAELGAVLELRLKELVPAAQEDEFLARARRELGELLAERNLELTGLAERLHVAERTLQRELGRRDTSHRALLDELRRTRAQKLLFAGLSVEQIAHELCFSEPSAFFRAFRRWTGRTPQAWRADRSID